MKDPEIIARIEALEEKYNAMGQDLKSYLDGLLEADYLTYWNYINLDALLNLQSPKTSYPDELIFILYHQITELYFKLILHELKQLSAISELTLAHFNNRLERMNRYWDMLVKSFGVMSEGMDKDQFLKFRMALLPASGFQSFQYRLIEISSTPAHNLMAPSKKQEANWENSSLDYCTENLYWKGGATELSSGKKTLTLNQFELKYSKEIKEQVFENKGKTLWDNYLRAIGSEEEKIVARNLLRIYDKLANVQWPLSHLKSAVRYLHKEPKEIAATGGTNWQKYLPPRFQLIQYFPALLSDQEKAEWGVKLE